MRWRLWLPCSIPSPSAHHPGSDDQLDPMITSTKPKRRPESLWLGHPPTLQPVAAIKAFAVGRDAGCWLVTATVGVASRPGPWPVHAATGGRPAVCARLGALDRCCRGRIRPGLSGGKTVSNHVG